MKFEITRDTAMTLIHWCDDCCFPGSSLNVFEGSMGEVVVSGIHG